MFCVLDGFKTWLADDMGLTYPDVLTTGCVAPCVRTEHFAKLIADYSEFLLRTIGISVKGQTSFIPSFGNTPSDTLRFDFQTTVPCGDRSSSVPMEQCRPLLMVQLYANATFKFNSPGAEVQPAIDAMDDMLTAVNGQGPAVAKHTAVRYVGIETEGALSGSAVKGTVGSMVLALVCILAATNNYLVTLWSMLVIMFIVIAVVGTMVMIGWTLGVIESICITIVVGLSVDYTIHLCHIFASSTAETRFEAGRDSLASMGVSVINAAITTLGSAVVLMLACKQQSPLSPTARRYTAWSRVSDNRGRWALCPDRHRLLSELRDFRLHEHLLLSILRLRVFDGHPDVDRPDPRLWHHIPRCAGGG